MEILWKKLGWFSSDHKCSDDHSYIIQYTCTKNVFLLQMSQKETVTNDTIEDNFNL